MSDDALQRLYSWPRNKPAGLVILGARAARAPRELLLRQLPADAAVTDWWVMDAENQLVAEPLRPDNPHYGWAALLETSCPDVALAWLQRLREQDSSDQLTIYLARPMPALAKRIVGLMRAVLNRIPLRVGDDAVPIPPAWLGGVNPTQESVAHAATLPQDEPIGVLNLHRYKAMAADPFTGEQASGKTIASRYLKRGFLTFMRVGGRVSWSAVNRGQLHGPPAPAWEIFGLIWYPHRKAFASMSHDPRFARAAGYRKAGMEIASVAQTHIHASSRRDDIRLARR